MIMNPKCSIVIRAYNEEKYIGKLLSGIAHQTISDVQVILVDSGSSDNTVEIAKKSIVDVVKIKPEEFTFGHSLNCGIQYAISDFVVIVSAHVYPVYPDWLENLLAPFENEKVALTYGKQRGAAVTQYSEHQIFKNWYPENTWTAQKHPFCNNANSAIRKCLWEERQYNEILPALEDLDWAKWAHEKGYLISYVAEAEIIHVHEQSWKAIYNRYMREGMAFKQIYPQEKFDILDLIRLFIVNAFSDFKSSIKDKVFFKSIINIINFRWMQFYGTFRGYAQSGPLTWQLREAFYYPRNHITLERSTTDRGVKPIDYKEKQDSAELEV